MGIPGQKRIGAVILQENILAIIDIARHRTRHILLNPAAQPIILVRDGRAIRPINLYKLILGIPVVGGACGSRFVYLRLEIAVVMIPSPL